MFAKNDENIHGKDTQIKTHFKSSLRLLCFFFVRAKMQSNAQCIRRCNNQCTQITHRSTFTISSSFLTISAILFNVQTHHD